MAACNNYNNFQAGTEEVVQQLNELFGNTLNLDIIRNVAKSCKFDVQQSSNQLLEITNHRYEPCVSPTANRSKMNPISPLQSDRKSRKVVDIENAVKKINSGVKVLVLLRGLPGSGKSTLAKWILKSTIGDDAEILKQHILSTDDFFMKNGIYQYDPNQIPEAHGWNHQRAFNVMCRGYSPVIIDNTNAQMWEMKPYAIMATDYGYILEILEPDTHWCFNDKELAKRNTHGVPKSTIRNMIDRYERNVTPMKLLTAYDCKYKLQIPPQLRLYPPISKEPPKPIEFCFNKPKPENNANITNFKHTTSLQSFSATNNKIPSTETINLMDFNEPVVHPTSSEPAKKQDKSNSTKSKSVNNISVDNMLMHDGGSLLKSTILKPLRSTRMTQSTSLFDNIHNAWGVDEKALRSWDIVTPLSETKNDDIELFQIDDDEPIIETIEASTSTDNEDFYILRNILNHSPGDNVVILDTCNRDINRNVPVRPQMVTKKLMLDKSCLTEDYVEDQNVHIEQLTFVFPNVPVRTLKYWYNKCNRDFECTLELLLAERDEVISIAIDDDMQEPEPAENIQESIMIDSDSGSSSASETSRIGNRNSKNKRKNNSSSDESNQLKRCIESKVTIGDDHYSQKILKIKQQRFGQPSTSDALQPGTSSALEPNSPTKESFPDMDYCECDPEFDGIEWEESSSELDHVDNIDTVELNLGDYFVKQLEDKFGDPNLLYPKGFQPVVQVPVALAKQLYTFYIESVYQQMDAQNSVMEALMKEDEEFARNLQEKEERAVQSAAHEINSQMEPTEIPEIMKEQKELGKWQKEADKWKELTPDTLAAKLTKDKLFNVFPALDKDTLVEILHAHDNVYKDTVETLLASTNISDVRGHFDSIKDPPIDRSTISEMWEAHESCQTNELENEPLSAADYREEANKFLKKRLSLYEKARRFFQNGMTEVAQFYSGLASQQTKLYEKANSFAVTAFMDEHSKRLQDINMLDLHFLYTKEAIPTLDVFLDRNINLLRLSRTKHMEYLQIITGRGKNSQNGIAKIRPAVIARLKKRKISWQQLNPGLLKVKITKNSNVTSEL